jgi:CheY-like chemotaxis protein
MEAIGRLAGGIAHDFNNLLTIILGYTKMLARKLPEHDPLQGKVEAIQNAGERAATLTRQLLAFSRREVVQPQALDLNLVISALEPMLRRLIGEDVLLAVSLEPELGRVMADPGQMEQVVLNLAVNARDAMPEGGRLLIETKNVEVDALYARLRSMRPGSYAMLALSDTGHGMDEDTKARIFEPFFTTKERGKGTGLGLSIVYGIVQQAGGTILVYSEPGQGATFKVYVPLVRQEAEAAAEALPAASPKTGTETVLIVEDERALRELVAEVLAAAGYTVLEAQTGTEAILISKGHAGPIHVLLTDLVMPEMSGRDLAEKIGLSRPSMKVLYMSGYTDDAVLRHGTLESDHAFIQKPFTEDGVLGKLRQVLDHPLPAN